MKNQTYPEVLMKTNVLNKYYVSTIYRACSACDSVWYYETIVFNYDSKKKKIGSIVCTNDSGESVEDAIINHESICYNIATEGIKDVL